MRERDAPRRPFGKRGVNLGNLKPEGAAIWPDRVADLLEEDREIGAVLERDRLSIRNLELDLQPERADLPVAGASQVCHRDPEMVELHHDAWPPVSS